MNYENGNNICGHDNIIYYSRQETLNPNKFLELYNCVDCRSTITLQKGREYNIIKNKKGSIIDIINILKNYIAIKQNKNL